MKKIGLFGGSFDPVHIGHISIATIALKELGLDEVQLIPTGHNPWKDDNHTEDVHRLNMLKLALKDEENITINTIELDDSSKTVNVDGAAVALTPTEYSILKLLISNQGKVYSPREIYRAIWSENPVTSENTIAVHVRHIREKIEINPAEPRYLKAVWGHGYMMGGEA